MNTPFELILTNSYKTGMISYLQQHPETFDEAVHLAISDRQPYSWRSAWVLCDYIQNTDSNKMLPFVTGIIQVIPQKADGHQRELLKILENVQIPEEHVGMLFDVCINIWQQIHKQPSVRYTAMKLMVNIAKQHPELANEIGFLVQNQYLETLSAGVQKAIRRMLRRLPQQTW